MIKVVYIIFFFFLFSCKNGSDAVKTTTTYFQNGKVESIFKLLNNHTLIDTVYVFYENGKIMSKVVYDSTGLLNGLTEVFDSTTGVSLGTTNFIHGIQQGKQIKNDSLGNLVSKTFFYNNKASGDKYIYKANKVVEYHFYDFEEGLATLIKYNEKGEIIYNERNRILLDSIKIEKLPNKFYLFKIFILQSNPLHTRNKLVANYYDKNGTLIDYDSISATGMPFIEFRKKFISNYLEKIVLTDTQYDSILNKTYIWDDIQNIKSAKPTK